MKAGGDSPAYQLFMLSLCVYALLALGAEVASPRESEIRQLLSYADTAVCVPFLADFFVSLYRAEYRWRYFYTWGWLDLRAVVEASAASAASTRPVREPRDVARKRELQDVTSE